MYDCSVFYIYVLFIFFTDYGVDTIISTHCLFHGISSVNLSFNLGYFYYVFVYVGKYFNS